MTRQCRVIDIIRKAKLRLLRMHYESRVGHIGGNLSCLDCMLTLHHRVMRQDDEFLLSKGHAAGSLYVTLWSLGVLTDDELTEFHQEGTRLPGHPPAQGIPGVLFATGSLGHGLGLAAGVALGKRLQQRPGRVYCLMSDGEWNEGSCWEALTFVAHHRLGNLCVVIDLNGLQGFGSTRAVANLGDLAAKLRSFGLWVTEVDGHDASAIEAALLGLDPEQPSAVVLHTVKGHGVSFMEGAMEWHYLPMDAGQYERALEEVGQS